MLSMKYIAEFIGTFALAFVVLAAAASTSVLPLAIPVIAGLTLALFVYTIGPVSGCHINPAVTIGQLSIGSIKLQDAVGYLIAQALAALAAIMVAKFFMITSPLTPSVFDSHIFAAEALGAFFFNFGIAAVVAGKVAKEFSGVVVGGSLLFGILVASLTGAAGILNPAVALALNAASVLYLTAPVVGAVLGVQAYTYLTAKH